MIDGGMLREPVLSPVSLLFDVLGGVTAEAPRVIVRSYS